MNNAIIAMSGGVDSSVAAYLTQKDGYELLGVTLSLYGEKKEDFCDAEAVADRLGFSHRVVDMKDEFEKEVISRFIDAYENVKTPNPCIFCNRFIKFGLLGDYAERNGYSYVATGHYARIERENGRYILKKGIDESKDQSYVLYSLTQKQLAHTLFPLGALSKSDVREIAEDNGFVNARRKDSQDICFVPDGDYAGFIERYIGKKYAEGNFEDFDGNVLGIHKGLIRYTVGQRKGLGLALPKPMYVCRLCPEKNSVILGDNSDLFSNTLEAEDINLITADRIDGKIRVEAKVRYSQKAEKATVWQTGEKNAHVEFDRPQRAITNGQAVVFYDGSTVVGGGTICRSGL